MPAVTVIAVISVAVVLVAVTTTLKLFGKLEASKLNGDK